MMPLDNTAVFHLCLLLLAVPAQYIITQYRSSSDGERTTTLKTMVQTVSYYKDEYMSWEKWQKWCSNWFDNLKSMGSNSLADDGDDMGESPAVEVLKYRDREGWFSESPEPRTSRPNTVLYRVGQVIKHRKHGYRGVIIGWDLQAKAPEDWLNEMHPKDKPHWRKLPNYSVLVDTRDRMVPQRTYVAQENIEIVSNTKVIHPQLNDYFEGYDGAQYLPRPSLKKLYPRD